MGFESVADAAKRLGVTTRTIQKWAKSEKLPGAVKMGRDWMIPDSYEKEPLLEGFGENMEGCVPMLLLNSAFPVGQCKAYFEEIQNEDIRNITLAEYYYFQGKAEAASRIVEKYLENPNLSLQMSAGFICIFANLGLGHFHLTELALKVVEDRLDETLSGNYSMEEKAVCVLFFNAASILMHVPVRKKESLVDYICYLPEGLKIFSYYVLAHEAYLRQEYTYSLGMMEAAMMMSPKEYPLPFIYTYLAEAICMMNLMHVGEAKKRFMKAWDIAEKEHFLQPFIEHYGLLQGLVEVCLKKSHPQIYKKIVDLSADFSHGWSELHNRATANRVTGDLSRTEFTIAMLYNRGWTIKEIAAHLEMSPRTISNHVRVIYEKLGVKNKKDLKEYLLK